jgi:hypothetical protein
MMLETSNVDLAMLGGLEVWAMSSAQRRQWRLFAVLNEVSLLDF